MPDQFIHKFLPPILNKPISCLLETGRSIHTHRIVTLSESAVTCKLFGSNTGHFINTEFGFRYTQIILSVAALLAWLRDYFGVGVDLRMEVIPI